jgi:hypothetical protein
MRVTTSVVMEKRLLDLARKLAEEDHRSVSAELAVLVEAEAKRRGWLDGVAEKPSKKKGQRPLSAVGP